MSGDKEEDASHREDYFEPISPDRNSVPQEGQYSDEGEVEEEQQEEGEDDEDDVDVEEEEDDDEDDRHTVDSIPEEEEDDEEEDGEEDEEGEGGLYLLGLFGFMYKELTDVDIALSNAGEFRAKVNGFQETQRIECSWASGFDYLCFMFHSFLCQLTVISLFTPQV